MLVFLIGLPMLSLATGAVFCACLWQISRAHEEEASDDACSYRLPARTGLATSPVRVPSLAYAPARRATRR